MYYIHTIYQDQRHSHLNKEGNLFSSIVLLNYSKFMQGHFGSSKSKNLFSFIGINISIHNTVSCRGLKFVFFFFDWHWPLKKNYVHVICLPVSIFPMCKRLWLIWKKTGLASFSWELQFERIMKNSKLFLLQKGFWAHLFHITCLMIQFMLYGNFVQTDKMFFVCIHFVCKLFLVFRVGKIYVAF